MTPAPDGASTAGAAGFEVSLFGVRGSTSAPGAAYCDVGGHTSCVGIGPTGEPPRLLLDAGTGIQNVTARCGGQPFAGEILLTHLHWDHLQGIPFFAGADRVGACTTVHVPRQVGASAGETMDAQMSPPGFPIDRTGLLGDWRFEDLDEGRVEAAGYVVLAREIPHKGGRTFGFRVEGQGASMAYLPDHGPCAFGPGPAGVGELHEAARSLVDGVDLLLHGGQFTNAEIEVATSYGHATIEYALSLADACGAGRVVLTHHSPSRSDDAVCGLEAEYGGSGVSFGREGDRVSVDAESPGSP
jgi:phosphoribosyl 1,2-cyclic phosphodiesterase